MSFRLILSKPKITLLLWLTGIVGYLIPSKDGIVFLDLLVFSIAGVLSSDGALIINYFIDRDIDIIMSRTKNRASVGDNAIPSHQVLLTGIGVSLVGVIIGWIYFGIWTAMQLSWGVLFYVFGYSLYLKRKSILNTIIGGLASPAPVWAGYAARYEILPSGPETLYLGVPVIGWLLGAVVFIWTPSHTWALSTKNYEDYKAVNLPMVPVRYGIPFTAKITFGWGILVIIYGAWLAYFLTGAPWVILPVLLASVLLGWGLWVFLKNPSVETGAKCFRAHNGWLAIVFLVILLFDWFT